jgi:ABC-type arginine/histidine transport system permease subunit
MDQIFTQSVRLELAVVLVLMGVGLVVAGVLSVARASDRQRSWPQWALTYLYVFRRVVVGLCLIGAGVGLAEAIPWLLAASLCIGFGEFLESSYYISVLRWGRRDSLSRARSASS